MFGSATAIDANEAIEAKKKAAKTSRNGARTFIGFLRGMNGFSAERYQGDGVPRGRWFAMVRGSPPPGFEN
jgi:hypothetical protein